MASGGHSSSRCAGLSPSRALLLRSTGSRRAGSVTVAHGPSCSTACGIFPDQGSNPCPLHQQADSQPLRHQGSPPRNFLANPIHLYLFPSQKKLITENKSRFEGDSRHVVPTNQKSMDCQKGLVILVAGLAEGTCSYNGLCSLPTK